MRLERRATREQRPEPLWNPEIVAAAAGLGDRPRGGRTYLVFERLSSDP